MQYAWAAKEDEFYADATTSKASESLLKGWKSRIHAEGFELDGLTMIVVSPSTPLFWENSMDGSYQPGRCFRRDMTSA